MSIINLGGSLKTCPSSRTTVPDFFPPISPKALITPPPSHGLLTRFPSPWIRKWLVASITFLHCFSSRHTVFARLVSTQFKVHYWIKPLMFLLQWLKTPCVVMKASRQARDFGAIPSWLLYCPATKVCLVFSNILQSRCWATKSNTSNGLYCLGAALTTHGECSRPFLFLKKKFPSNVP